MIGRAGGLAGCWRVVWEEEGGGGWWCARVLQRKPRRARENSGRMRLVGSFHVFWGGSKDVSVGQPPQNSDPVSDEHNVADSTRLLLCSAN